MPYSQTWDASAPDGAITPAADIDAEFQNLKVALGERLAQIMPEWADDLEDPKKIAIVIGTAAARPATPDFAGEMYFASDIATLYVADSTPAWVATGGLPDEGDDETTSSAFNVTAILSANQSIPQAVDTALSGWTIPGSRGQFYSGAQPTRFTIPAKGDYFLTAHVYVQSGATWTLKFASNGNLPYTGQSQEYTLDHASTISLSRVLINLSVGDYIEVIVNQVSAVPQDVYGSAYTVFVMHRLP